MARAIKNILSDIKRYSEFQKGAIKEAKKYNWDRTARESLELIEKIVK